MDTIEGLLRSHKKGSILSAIKWENVKNSKKKNNKTEHKTKQKKQTKQTIKKTNKNSSVPVVILNINAVIVTLSLP